MTRIDEDSRRKFHTILSLSRSRGADVVDALDKAGLLRYPDRMRQDRLDILAELINSIDEIPTYRLGFEYLPTTALDLQARIVKFLTEIKQGLEKRK